MGSFIRGTTMWIRTAALGLALVGCSSPEIYGTEYSVHIDPAFSPAEDAVIRTSLAHWSAGIPPLHLTYTSGTCSRTSSPTGTICIHRSDLAGVRDAITNRPTAGPGIVWDASTNRSPDDTSDIWIAMDAPDNTSGGKLGSNVQHEAGHAFGLEHTDGPSVMFWNCDEKGSSPEVTAVDVNQFLYLRKLSTVTPAYFH
jgi:hypothetical protein